MDEPPKMALDTMTSAAQRLRMISLLSFQGLDIPKNVLYRGCVVDRGVGLLQPVTFVLALRVCLDWMSGRQSTR